MDMNVLKIKEKTKELNNKYYKDTVPPIFAIKIAQEEGLFIAHKEFSDKRIACLDRKSRTIFLTNNKELLDKWGNFAIAHELGHWFLDTKPVDYFDPSTLDDPNCGIEDKNANLFATYLLIPDNLYQEWSWLDKNIFASAFRVPAEGIALRKDLC